MSYLTACKSIHNLDTSLFWHLSVKYSPYQTINWILAKNEYKTKRGIPTKKSRFLERLNWTGALGVALEYVFGHGRMKLGRNSCDTSVFEYTVSNGDDLYCPQDKLLHTLVTNLVASSSVLQLFKSNTERSFPNIKLHSGESPYCVRIVLYPDCFN